MTDFTDLVLCRFFQAYDVRDFISSSSFCGGSSLGISSVHLWTAWATAMALKYAIAPQFIISVCLTIQQLSNRRRFAKLSFFSLFTTWSKHLIAIPVKILRFVVLQSWIVWWWSNPSHTFGTFSFFLPIVWQVPSSAHAPSFSAHAFSPWP